MARTQKSPRKEVSRPVWAEVSLSALAQNLQAIRKYVNPPEEKRKTARKILSIVKGNGYGHGRRDCGSQGRCSKADSDPDKLCARRRNAAGETRPHCRDSSLRTTGGARARGGAAREKARAVSFENRYGNEPAGHCYFGHGMLCAAACEVQASATHGNFFPLRLFGSFHRHCGWATDTRARRAILRGAGPLARAGRGPGNRASCE